MTVKGALRPDSSLKEYVVRGMKAVSKPHREVISADSLVVDSVALDEAARSSLPDKPRWDYLLGLRTNECRIVGVEIHPARSSEVKSIIDKKRGAEIYLRGHLAPGRSVERWVWMASGTSSITGTGSESRQLALAGIRFVGGHLDLKRLTKE